MAKYKDYVSICPHCFCGTHTLEDGTCGKCGGYKAKVGTTNNEVEDAIAEIKSITAYPYGDEDLRVLLNGLLFAQKKQIVERLPNEKDVENIEIPKGGNIGEYRFCEELRREGWNACLAAVKEVLSGK